jgi:hypothetical protein
MQSTMTDQAPINYTARRKHAAAHWREGRYLSKGSIEWIDKTTERLPESWFPTLRAGDLFRCRAWCDESGKVRGVEAVNIRKHTETL